MQKKEKIKNNYSLQLQLSMKTKENILNQPCYQNILTFHEMTLCYQSFMSFEAVKVKYKKQHW